MNIKFTAWKVTDSHGNETGGISEDFGKSIQVSGMRNTEDTKHLYFEDEFRYLPQWCIENNLSYYSSFDSIDL